MYLERIEITGFKSFADKTTIVFDKGVTAVVGPNGSGKSNLSEAIKWVLGEQSAKSLRGKKMDDIIFAGSQTRKPTNIAEVTLVLNNEDHFLPLDYSQIQLTRRMNRKGESECFINKKPCRLKDIVNLLMDSGLGKDSFSIISQGKVETIFHNKPEERRGMFEEVAGVLKYKTRKKEASAKLDKTQDHLDRVKDIVFEIEKQLAPLQKQKENAQLYLEKKADLSRVDIAVMVSEIDASSAQVQILQKEQAQIQAELQRNQGLEQTYEAQIAQNRQALSRLEEELSKLQAAYVSQVQSLEQKIGQGNLYQERLAYSKQNKSQQEEQKQSRQARRADLLDLIAQTKADITQKTANLKDLTAQEASYKASQEALLEEGSQVLEDRRETYMAALQEETSLKNELAYAKRQIDLLQERQVRMDQQASEHEANLQELTQTIQDQEEQLQGLSQALEAESQTYKAQHQDYQAQRFQKHELSEQLEKLKGEKNRIEARRLSLSELQEDYAGYYQGVRSILKQKQYLLGIEGSLAELIKVDQAYTLAIDIALGASLQHLVVTDEKAAQAAIAYLKEKRLGRATFLPLSVIKARKFPDQILSNLKSDQGFVGLGDQLVQTEGKYAAIVSNLLGQTVVTDTIQSASRLAKTLQYRYRIVTLQGEIVHAGGSMTGGASKQQGQSLLSRQADLEALSHQLRQVKDQINALVETLSAVDKSLADKKTALDKIQEKGTQDRLLERELTVSLEQNRQRMIQLDRQVKVSQMESKQNQEALRDYEEGFTRAQEDLERVAAKVKAARQILDDLNVSQEEKSQRLSDLQEKLQAILPQIAVLKEQVDSHKGQLKAYEEEASQVEQSLEALRYEETESQQTSQDLAQALEDLTQEIAEGQAKEKRISADLTQLKLQKEQLDQDLSDAQVVQKKIQADLQSLLKAQGTNETKMERFNVTIDNHLNRLSQDYQLTYEAAKLEAHLDMSIAAAVARVAQLKREIDQLGPVNLAAIEEFEEVSQRFSFMTAQEADLIAAKDQLLATMSEMDEEVKQRFSQTFYAIKAHFEKTFPKLFGGGRATLELTDPDNLLETGIDIIAQPPGKRLQNLSLLSGGEKAFTAIALLFAILEVKPVPFCLLDEVEAALDEANVGRYGRYLKEFIDQTQFIVITHRKGTMEEADVLYGVTMQESGVSKLASVKFEDYHKAVEAQG